MKITKEELANIIKEEVEKALGGKSKKQYDTLMSYGEKRKEFNKKIGVKNTTDYYYKLGVAGPSSKKPDKYSPKGYHSIPDMGKFKEAKKKYQDAVRHYVRTGEVRNPLK